MPTDDSAPSACSRQPSVAALEFERDAEVFQHRVPRQQRALLKDERRRRAAAVRLHRRSPTRTLPARRIDQAADDFEQRALPATRRAEQTHELARG